MRRGAAGAKQVETQCEAGLNEGSGWDSVNETARSSKD